MRIIFAGTSNFALPILQTLITSSHKILAVYTKPDKPQGRGLKKGMTPVKKLAIMANIPIKQPLTLRDQKAQKELQEFKTDLLINVAYGLFFPKEMLSLPKYGCINVHPSLLPRWRGASPIQYAILAGDNTTGVTIMEMDEGLDTGPILRQTSVDLEPFETTSTLSAKLADLGAELLLSFLNDLEEKKEIEKIIQNPSQATYAKKITKEDARIDWHKSSEELDRMIRAFNPWPVAYTKIDDITIRIFKALPLSSNDFLKKSDLPPGTIINSSKDGIDVTTGNGILRLVEMQLAGGRILQVKEILNSKRDLFEINKKFSF